MALKGINMDKRFWRIWLAFVAVGCIIVLSGKFQLIPPSWFGSLWDIYFIPFIIFCLYSWRAFMRGGR